MSTNAVQGNGRTGGNYLNPIAAYTSLVAKACAV